MWKGLFQKSGGCGCGEGCKDPNTCPALVMVENQPLYRRAMHGPIPKRAYSLWFFPDPQGECEHHMVRVEFQDVLDQIDAATFGDVKMNAFATTDRAVGDGWFLPTGRDFEFFDANGDRVEGDIRKSPDVRGKVVAMPDAGDYFCHGITEPGDVTGESAHLMDASELGNIEFDVKLNIDFNFPVRNSEVESGTGTTISHFDGGGGDPDGDSDDIRFSTVIDDNLFNINAEGSATNSSSDPKPFNIMQPTIGMNFFIYMNRDGLTAKPIEGSETADRGTATGYFTQTQELNNCKPWGKKKQDCC